MYIVENIGDVNIKSRKSHWSNGEFLMSSFVGMFNVGNVQMSEIFFVTLTLQYSVIRSA